MRLFRTACYFQASERCHPEPGVTGRGGSGADWGDAVETPGARPGSRRRCSPAASWPRRRLAAVRLGAGTSSGSAPPSKTLSPAPGHEAHPAAAWPTYGRDFARSGVAAGVAAPGPLAVSWRVHLDGAVYGQPLLVGNLVIAATENDSVYGLDQATGKVAADARRHPGAPGRACRAATSTRSASPARRSTTRPAGWSTPWRRPRLPPRAGRRLGPRRHLQVERDSRPGRAAAVRPAAARAQYRGRAGVRGVRRAVRGLRAVPRLGVGIRSAAVARSLLRGPDGR